HTSDRDRRWPGAPTCTTACIERASSLRHFCDRSWTPKRHRDWILEHMTPERPFRFGVVAATARDGDGWRQKAQRIESLGYATLLTPDTLQYPLAALPALAAAASATRTLRIGTYVLANDFRNPVLLAKEAATLDFLSGGRFELGLGAGRPTAANDNRMLGLPFDSGRVRLARLAESLALGKALLSLSEPVTASGMHYQVQDAQVGPAPIQQPRPPILIAASGKEMLALAAREADIIALGVAPTATESEVADKVDWIRESAGDGF